MSETVKMAIAEASAGIEWEKINKEQDFQNKNKVRFIEVNSETKEKKVLKAYSAKEVDEFLQVGESVTKMFGSLGVLSPLGVKGEDTDNFLNMLVGNVKTAKNIDIVVFK
ncbi:hypothetical protein HNP86_001714 [Methanococcus maripaludis]|uniref:Uncharacterized protein n=1 Tax=Methanococcus maripaludis TaxID=39152 RepID=A0A7J9NW69_METMI|nr:hypothetical protein [Methanococcus maripaludis]MBA2851561.1 hypothetical protein [Methanococcus maripaludis]